MPPTLAQRNQMRLWRNEAHGFVQTGTTTTDSGLVVPVFEQRRSYYVCVSYFDPAGHNGRGAEMPLLALSSEHWQAVKFRVSVAGPQDAVSLWFVALPTASEPPAMAGVWKVGEDGVPFTLSNPIKNRLRNFYGVNIDSVTLPEALWEVSLAGDEANPSKWNPLQPSPVLDRRRPPGQQQVGWQEKIQLGIGSPWWVGRTVPIVQGGAVVDDDFATTQDLHGNGYDEIGDSSKWYVNTSGVAEIAALGNGQWVVRDDTDVGAADWAELECNTLDAGAGYSVWMGPSLRHVDSDNPQDHSGYAWDCHDEGGWHKQRIVEFNNADPPGTTYLTSQVTMGSGYVGNGDLLTIRVEGSIVSIHFNGEQLASADDSTYTASGRTAVGFWGDSWGGANSVPKVNNLHASIIEDSSLQKGYKGLFTIGDGGMSSGEQAVGDLIGAKGNLELLYETIAASATEHTGVDNFDFIVNSELPNSNEYNGKYEVSSNASNPIAVPMLMLEHLAWSEQDYTNTDGSNVSPSTATVDKVGTHPIISTLGSNPITVLTSSVNQGLASEYVDSWGSGATQFLSIASDSTEWIGAAYEASGSMMQSGTAQAKAVALGFQDPGVAALATDGETIIKRSIQWLLGFIGSGQAETSSVKAGLGVGVKWSLSTDRDKAARAGMALGGLMSLLATNRGQVGLAGLGVGAVDLLSTNRGQVGLAGVGLGSTWSLSTDRGVSGLAGLGLGGLVTASQVEAHASSALASLGLGALSSVLRNADVVALAGFGFHAADSGAKDVGRSMLAGVGLGVLDALTSGRTGRALAGTGMGGVHLLSTDRPGRGTGGLGVGSLVTGSKGVAENYDKAVLAGVGLGALIGASRDASPAGKAGLAFGVLNQVSRNAGVSAQAGLGIVVEWALTTDRGQRALAALGLGILDQYTTDRGVEALAGLGLGGLVTGNTNPAVSTRAFVGLAIGVFNEAFKRRLNPHSPLTYRMHLRHSRR